MPALAGEVLGMDEAEKRAQQYEDMELRHTFVMGLRHGPVRILPRHRSLHATAASPSALPVDSCQAIVPLPTQIRGNL